MVAKYSCLKLVSLIPSDGIQGDHRDRSEPGDWPRCGQLPAQGSSPRSGRLQIRRPTKGPERSISFPGRICRRRHDCAKCKYPIYHCAFHLVRGADGAVLQVAARIADVAIKSFGKLDGVVINHGVLSPIARLEHADVEEWKRLYDTNLFSALALVGRQRLERDHQH